MVLSDRVWRDRFGGDPSIVGRAVNLNGAPYTVVGVMPAGFAFPRAAGMPGSFTFPAETQLWVPLALSIWTDGPRRAERAGRGRTAGFRDAARARAGGAGCLHPRDGAASSRRRKGWFNSPRDAHQPAARGRHAPAAAAPARRRSFVVLLIAFRQRREPAADAIDRADAASSRCAPRSAPGAGGSCVSS